MGGDAGSPWGQAGGPGERDRKSIGGQTGVPPRDRQEVHREQAGSPQSRVWWRSMGMGAERRSTGAGQKEQVFPPSSVCPVLRSTVYDPR